MEQQKNRLLENIMAVLPNFVFWKDTNLIYLGCNDNAANLLRLASPAEIIGKSDYDLPWERDFVERFRCYDQDVINSGKAKLDLGEVLTLANGDVVDVIIDRKPFYDDKGNLSGVLIIAVESEKRNLADQVFFEHLLKSLPYYIFWKNKESIYLGCNHNFAKLVGKNSSKDIVGLTDFDLGWGEGEAEFFREADRKVMCERDQVNLEEYLKRPDDSQIVMLVSKAPVRNKENVIIGILGISVDITYRKKMEMELAQAKNSVEKINHGLMLMAGSIAHELRTPLASVTLAAQGLDNYLPSLLSAYKLAKENGLEIQHITSSRLDILNDLTKTIQNEVRYSNVFIDMLLMNIRMPEVAREKMQNCSIRNCISQALKRYPLMEAEKELITYQDTNDFIFKGDESLMIHVIFNLLKNSLYYIKVAEKGHIYIWLEVGSTNNKLYFKDTAKGIAPDVITYIFERFYSKTQGGSGIGLAFCKMVMNAFDGDIICQSVENEYVQFILNFP